MNEAIFPLLGTAFVVVIVLPACSLLAKWGLVLLERPAVGGPLQGLNVRYVLLTCASLLPLAWFSSAGLHEAETGSGAACLLEHDAARCFEPGFFALVLVTAALASSLRILRQQRRAQASRSSDALELAGRLERLLDRSPALSDLQGRLVVTDDVGFALGTQGLLRPRVVVGTAFARELSDEMLVSALGHEREHVRALDPLRYLVLQIALSVNPVGRGLLDCHAARWRSAREAHCDREAVIGGAAPLALAEAIVRAARPAPRHGVALGARDTAILEFRIGLLLAFAEEAPVRARHQHASAFPVGVLLVLIALLLPHHAGTAPLDALHLSAEHALTFVLP